MSAHEETTYRPATPESSEDCTMSLRFDHLQLHASGGLGEVYRATERETSRDVALKFIRNNFLKDEEVRKRFQLEAEITARLEHPGVVPVHGLGVTSNNRPFYVMRFVEGETLDDAIRRHHRGDKQTGEKTVGTAERSLEFRSLLQRFISVCNTIAYAHNRGIVHRDIKPHNILLGRFGETLVVDWGLAMPVERDADARASGEQTLHVRSQFGSQSEEDSGASSGSGAGTPAYMSPEQAAGSFQLGPASDVYSLGATLYKILTGTAPFHGDPILVMQQVTKGEFPAPSLVHDQVPRALEAICLRAMARQPAQRYRSALDMAADIENYLADEEVSVLPDGRFQRWARWARHHRGAVASLMVSLLVLTGVGIGSAVLFSEQARREHQLLDEAIQARQSEYQLRQDSVQASAEFAASSIANQIDLRWRILEQAAADSRLPGIFAQINENPAESAHWAPLQEWMDEVAPRDREVAFSNWQITAVDGTQVARYPSRYADGRPYSSLGQRFAFRDYFHGRGRDYDDDQEVARPPLTKAVHLSTALESMNDSQLLVMFSVPVRHPETGSTLGVLGMSVPLGEIVDQRIRLPEGQKVLVVDTRQYFLQRRLPELHSESGEGLVLHHPDLDDTRSLNPLPHLDTNSLRQLRATPPRGNGASANQVTQSGGPTPPPAVVAEGTQGTSGLNQSLLSDYRDPLSEDSSHRWIAAFAPVVVKSRPAELSQTGWFVIVQQLERSSALVASPGATSP